MGCLFELIFEFVTEIIIEGWMYLLCLVIPQKKASKKLQNTIKTIIAVSMVLGFLSMIVGLVAMTSDDFLTKPIGYALFFIPLCLSAVQITVGIIIRACTSKNDKK